MCNITGFLYNATGQVISTGSITLQLQQDMVFNNQKVAPFTLTIDLSTTGGYVDWTVFPTVGATPAGIMYKLEFDPDPLDETRPMKQKPGYFRNFINVPDQASIALGAFTSALRGQPSGNFMPIGGAASSIGDDLTLGTGTDVNKNIIANIVGSNDPKIRYNVTTDRWEFSDDGTTFNAMLQGGGGAVGGDLSGTVGSATVTKIQGDAVSATNPSTTGQVLRWNTATSQYEPSLDGSQLTSLNASNLGSGTVPLARLTNLTNAEISASAAIAWSKISKIGSSLADLATKSASALDSGTLALARLGGYEHSAGNSGTALTIDWANGTTQYLTLTGNCTFTLSNPRAGERYVLFLIQDGTGSRTVTWPAAVQWVGGSAPTLSTVAGSIDYIILHYSAAGTNKYHSYKVETSGVIPIDLTSEVTGDLPLSNLAQCSAASRLLGRGSAAGAGDFQEITLGSGLQMTGNTLEGTSVGAPVTPTYVTLSTDVTLVNERVLTGSGRVSVTDGGAGGNVVLDVPNDGISYAKIQNVAAASRVLGRGSAGGSGDVEELTPAGGLEVSTTNLQIANDGVTYAKMQNISAASRLLGRGSAGGSGDPEEIALAANMEMSGTTLKAKIRRVVGGIIGDGTNVITTGVQAGCVSCPVSGTITKVRLLSSDAAITSGSIVVDVWKDTYANYPPTVADTITAAAKPTITSATKSEDATLTGWTTAVAAGDVFRYNVDSVTAFTMVTIELTIEE
jgi:hypothetical protein